VVVGSVRLRVAMRRLDAKSVSARVLVASFRIGLSRRFSAGFVASMECSQQGMSSTSCNESLSGGVFLYTRL